jgi:hypothetical protein
MTEAYNPKSSTLGTRPLKKKLRGAPWQRTIFVTLGTLVFILKDMWNPSGF